MSNKILTSSVAICTYNGEKYIAEQINSIISQSIKPNQIVICDDGSSDDTILIAKSILDDSGIDYLININKQRLGITKNFDNCFSLCSNDIIFPCDQDNVWHPEFIESFLLFFQKNPTIVFAYCNGYVTDKNLKMIKETYTKEQMTIDDKTTFLLNSLNKIFAPHGHTIAVRKEFVLRCMPCGFYYDCWFTMCAAAEGSIGAINKNLIDFRRHEDANSVAEGGGKKKSAINRVISVNRESFDDYFVWPYFQYKAYERYLSLYNDKLSDSIKNEIFQHLSFEKEINDLRYYKFLKREKKLYDLYTKGLYKRYRGNRNAYILDVIYLSVSFRRE